MCKSTLSRKLATTKASPTASKQKADVQATKIIGTVPRSIKFTTNAVNHRIHHSIDLTQAPSSSKAEKPLITNLENKNNIEQKLKTHA